ncbi:glycoside hydrolase family 3 N-terminal domain-containing protein [Chitinophaga sp. sic0106]|uniref:glycoside hydrolase family 3 N-terminal domain-containing protein n=1 Tax=Chitinophaga sp. sic0106 TaxID=2854785 RepID=UPI001C438E40|nr:glycoside hydrolase family 3 N-terminal domain-containing protein [Chitinophaga sp. sic0106]MBV7530082.1 glycoside hydrolase family 3 C-terminal domain-containing protein [Chitinophaga sp. sic0106]
MKLRITATGLLTALTVQYAVAQKQQPIYRNGWIDFNKNGKKDIFEDPTQTVDDRVKDLLSQMTLDEKTCQMATLYGYGRVLKDEMPTPEWKKQVWKDGIANIDEELNSVANNRKAQTKYSFPYSTHAAAINTVQKWFIEETRLGIPVDFTNEGIHGLNHDRATPLPAPIGIGSTWNRALVHRAGEIGGREAKLLGYTNVYAPILDPARDPRWGRVVECYGEDPFLIAELGKQMVMGIQSQGVASTLKHYAVYSIPKGGRDGDARTDPHVAPREMHQIYLYPFRRVIQEAKPMGVMSSYNDWDGEPVTGSYYFLTQLLRQQFGFDGYVVSDSEAVEYLFSKHHVAADYKEAVRQTVEAGLNVRTNFTPPENFINPLRELVKEGKVNMKTIDSRVGDVLRVKFRLGLFDHPYVDEKLADKGVHTAADDSFALQLNRESLVLLKNEKNTLPLNRGAIKNVLVTGPMATAVSHANSRYGPSNNPVISVLDGIRKMAGKGITVNYSQGCDIVNPGWPGTEIIPTPLSAEEQAGIADAVSKAKDADVIIAVVGEDDKRVGESLSRTSLDLPGRQLQLLQALHATGKPVVAVLINGQPLTINWENQNLPAILEAWFPGPNGGIAVAEALFGDYNPGGKLTVTFPKSLGQLELNFPFKPGSHAGQPSSGNNGFGRTSVNGALYPFGYGLSYTTFEYSNLVITPDQQRQQGDIQVSVDVTNTGSKTGDEVAQLYMHDKVSSVTTYVWQLRGFERVTLKPGEKKTLHFTLHPDHLALLDKDMNWTVEPGEFEIAVGTNSEDLQLKKTFTIIR